MTNWASITSADFQDEGWFSAPNIAEVHPAYRDTPKTSIDGSEDDDSELPAYGDSQLEKAQAGAGHGSGDSTALALSDLKIDGGGDKIALPRVSPTQPADSEAPISEKPQNPKPAAVYSLFPFTSTTTNSYGAPPFQHHSKSSSQNSTSLHSSPQMNGHSPTHSYDIPPPPSHLPPPPPGHVSPTPPTVQYPFSPQQYGQLRSPPDGYFGGSAPPLSPPPSAKASSPYPPRSSSCNSPPRSIQDQTYPSPMPSPGAFAPIHYDNSLPIACSPPGVPYVNHSHTHRTRTSHTSIDSSTGTTISNSTSPKSDGHARRTSLAKSTTASLMGSPSRLRNMFRSPVHPVIEAAKLGDAAEVFRLLTPTDFIHHSCLAADKDGWTALHWASRLGHEGVIRAVLESVHREEGEAGMRALVEARTRDKNDRTALYLAAQNNHLDCALLLIQAGAADVNAASKMDGATALHKAAQQGHEGMVLLLLHGGANVNRKDVEGMPPVMWATQGKRLRAAQILIANGANLEARIRLGANTELASREGLTVLVKAVASNNLDFARLFLSMGADPNADAPFGMRALHRAAAKGYVDLVRLLLDCGADHATVSEESWTPLHCAARHGHRECCEALLEAGASDAAMTSDGLIPRDLAIKYGHEGIV